MEFKIEDRLIGDGHPAFIIAELSANHMNDYDIAVKTIEAMAEYIFLSLHKVGSTTPNRYLSIYIIVVLLI